MISELSKCVFINGLPVRVGNYLLNRISHDLPIGSEFTLRALLPEDYETQGSLHQLGREFRGLFQTGDLIGVEEIHSNPMTYRKVSEIRGLPGVHITRL